MRLQDEHRVDRRQRALAAFLLLFACEDSAVYLDGTPQPCVIETDVETCESSYVPVWHNVYGRTLAPGQSCNCHASPELEGSVRSGLVLEGSTQAYWQLLDDVWVRPGDAACSRLIRILETTMPAEGGLDEGDVCSIARWVEAGARAAR